jgi:predicted metal-binding protein
MGLDVLLDKYGFKQHRQFDPELIVIDPTVRAMCKQNTCGQYLKNHMCPPAIKDIEAWKKEIDEFKDGIIVTKVYGIKGSFDLKAMLNGMADFQKTLLRLKEGVLAQSPQKKILLLGAGACRFCEKCSYQDGEPCRFPDKAFPSLEACGIDVMSLSREVGVNYHNGKNTVTYIGVVLTNS